MISPTKVVFLWHMHQPSYKHPTKGHYILPWVRLHGIKDYWGMAKTIEKFDKAKVAFNFSGVLIEQLLDYVRNQAQDYYGILTLKNPAYFKKEERDFVIDRFFSINFDRFIRPNKRYLQLHTKKMAKAHFTAQDLGDLMAIFNLCWFHPYTFKKDSHLRALVRKGKGYTREDRGYIMNKHYELLRAVLPLYQKLLRDNRIEVTLTPHYHPIMPLINDTDILKEFPYMKKPHLRFSAPQDCRWHLRKAKDTFNEAFNYIPQGSWPSEGSVSEPIAEIYADEDFTWLGADEGILFKSLVTDYVSYDMISKQRHILYRPYNYNGVNFFFRDRNLSDTISFVYQGWPDQRFAAADLMEHFKRTHEYAKNIFKERVITIIMDGENAWEYYPNNGIDFLESVYSALEKSDILATTTPSDHLKKDQGRHLERLAPGSWINGDFGVWIGSKENNNYWDILRRVKDAVDQRDRNNPDHNLARDFLYLIEGSDWYWWNTFHDFSGEFRNIFHYYVQEIYRLLGRPAPLISPLKTSKK